MSEVDRLRDENETLREQVRQLREQLGLSAPADFQACCRLAFGMSKSEASILSVLIARPMAPYELLLEALPRGFVPSDDRTMGNVSVHVCRMRRRLAEHGIGINTVWGFGFSIDPAGRARASALIEGAA